MNVSTMQPQYRTVTAAGFAGALMTIAAYLLAHWHIVLPQQVVDAATFLITSCAAWIVHPKTAPAVEAETATGPAAAAAPIAAPPVATVVPVQAAAAPPSPPPVPPTTVGTGAPSL
jgi:hypothetical protein